MQLLDIPFFQLPGYKEDSTTPARGSNLGFVAACLDRMGVNAEVQGQVQGQVLDPRSRPLAPPPRRQLRADGGARGLAAVCRARRCPARLVLAGDGSKGCKPWRGLGGDMGG